jgi:hypothetical protein
MVDDSIIEEGIESTENEVISSLDELKLKTTKRESLLDEEDIDNASWHELPGDDNLPDDGGIAVMPQKLDEFNCHSCFLIKHYSMLSTTSTKENPICKDCE